MSHNGSEPQPATPPSQTDVRHDWQPEDVLALMRLPLTELIHKAQSLHRRYHPENTVQLASLLSIKTGACPEDCNIVRSRRTTPRTRVSTGKG